MIVNDKETALILGGSTGMSLETARRLLQRGTPVHLVARSAERLARAADQLEPLGQDRVSAVDLAAPLRPSPSSSTRSATTTVAST